MLSDLFGAVTLSSHVAAASSAMSAPHKTLLCSPSQDCNWTHAQHDRMESTLARFEADKMKLLLAHVRTLVIKTGARDARCGALAHVCASSS